MAVKELNCSIVNGGYKVATSRTYFHLGGYNNDLGDMTYFELEDQKSTQVNQAGSNFFTDLFYCPGKGCREKVLTNLKQMANTLDQEERDYGYVLQEWPMPPPFSQELEGTYEIPIGEYRTPIEECEKGWLWDTCKDSGTSIIRVAFTYDVKCDIVEASPNELPQKQSVISGQTFTETVRFLDYLAGQDGLDGISEDDINLFGYSRRFHLFDEASYLANIGTEFEGLDMRRRTELVLTVGFRAFCNLHEEGAPKPYNVLDNTAISFVSDIFTGGIFSRRGPYAAETMLANVNAFHENTANAYPLGYYDDDIYSYYAFIDQVSINYPANPTDGLFTSVGIAEIRGTEISSND